MDPFEPEIVQDNLLNKRRVVGGPLNGRYLNATDLAKRAPDGMLYTKTEVENEIVWLGERIEGPAHMARILAVTAFDTSSAKDGTTLH